MFSDSWNEEFGFSFRIDEFWMKDYRMPFFNRKLTFTAFIFVRIVTTAVIRQRKSSLRQMDENRFHDKCMNLFFCRKFCEKNFMRINKGIGILFDFSQFFGPSQYSKHNRTAIYIRQIFPNQVPR